MTMTAQSHPHMFVTQTPVAGLRCVDDLRRDVRAGVPQQLWERLRHQAETALQQPPYIPSSPLPGRSSDHIRLQIRDYAIVEAACSRIKQAAVAWLVTEERRFVDDAMRQLDAVFDPLQWPDWPDQAHLDLGLVADLRTGQFLRAIGYAYDWLHEALSPAERGWMVAQLDRRGIQPYLQEVARNAWFTSLEHMNNWNTVVVGGAGMAAMALGNAHPDSARLLEQADRLMHNYLGVFGAEGEFNESVFYANSVRMPVEFFTARRYHSDGGDNRLAESPFTTFCRWYMHVVLPPGRVAAFGDGGTQAVPAAAFFPAVAAAARDGVFQQFYLEHLNLENTNHHRDLAIELLSFDPTVIPRMPEGRLPRGRAYREHSALWSSRTDWNPRTTACVVYGKGGHGCEGHGHHDAGQVCIEAFGESLIVDLGSKSYPPDFFGPNRWHYYDAGIRGHNVPMIGGREMRTERKAAAVILDAAFDDAKGGYWQGDMTALYTGAASVRRLVVHLHPAVVAVLDNLTLVAEEEVSLRWHTAAPCEPTADGAFTVAANGVQLSARIFRLDAGEPLSIRRGEHAYAPPFDRDRYGQPLPQRREPFVEAHGRCRACRTLTLFCAYGPGRTPASWNAQDGAFRIDTGDGIVTVHYTPDGGLRVRHAGTGHEWKVNLQQGDAQ